MYMYMYLCIYIDLFQPIGQSINQSINQSIGCIWVDMAYLYFHTSRPLGSSESQVTKWTELSQNVVYLCASINGAEQSQ